MTAQTSAKKTICWTLIALLLLFIGPMIAAWSLYTSKEGVLKTVNYGTLITPPLQLSALPLQDTDQQNFPKEVLQHRWVLLYVAPTPCAKLCELNLYNMRQVRTALNKNRERVVRMLVTYPESANPALDKLIEQQYLGTFHAVATPEALQHFLGDSLFATATKQQGILLLVDPLGNVMMQYAPTTNPTYLLKDLTRLLGVSQIG
jgi:cytochrome oxidase Cu insertion factor (SCO1/SenC/PrrC family)